ncbi:hypothetical protein ABPG72_016705 [Tetrahymena utriculariae]
MLRNSPQKQNYECWNCSDIIEGRDTEKLMNDSYGHHITSKDPNEEECPCHSYEQNEKIHEIKIGSNIISTYPTINHPLTEEEEKYLHSHMCHFTREQYLRSIIKDFYE